MDDLKIKEEIRQYILNKFLPGETASNLRDDTELQGSGILDSMATLELVSFLEKKYGIEVEAHEANADDFDSIASIVSFVKSKGSRA
jgi:acyl carrier protein